MTILLTKRPKPAPPTPLALQTAADIDHMIAVLESNGWHQHDYYDTAQTTIERITPARARVCMYGALNIVLCDSPVPLGVLTTDRTRRYWAVVRAVADHLDTIGIYFWQHEPERTEGDVLDALRATAATLRGETP